MALLDFLDKIDDIVYEPVRVVSDYLREPIKAIDAHIEMKKEQKRADIEDRSKQKEVNLEIQKADALVELEAKKRRLNAEIDNLIADDELRRNTAIVEAIKQYQIDLSQAVNECINQIGIMSIELREKANNLVIEKTNAYRELQTKSKTEAYNELKEINEMFSDNERVRIQLEDAVIEQMKNMIKTADAFIKELQEDMIRLNKNIDVLTANGQQLVGKYLDPITTKMVSDKYKGIEQKV